jgi:asparagine synthase (glutamine-hydrolysing)
MSAIFGIWNINGRPAEERLLRRMEAKIRHYGRDAHGLRIDDTIGLGCCLHNCGAYSQADIPVVYDGSGEVALVCDALIFNRAELMDKLGFAGNDAVSTQSLLLAAYQKWGEECPRHINGDFAFAIWEKRKRQLFIARDHLGVRPFYYFYDGSIFAFATDYRALLVLPFVGRGLDDKYMYCNLVKVCSFDPEATCFADIKALPQAHVLRIDGQGIRKEKYWTPGAGRQIVFETEAEYARALYNIADDAVRLRVHSASGKIGGELSGGLDSSVITVLANRELNKEGKKLEYLFSWSPPFGYIEKLPNDERALLERVCRQEKLECVFFDPSIPSGNPDEILPPDAGDAVIVGQERAVMASRGVDVILSGWGGDQGISHRTDLFGLLWSGYGGHFIGEIRSLAEGSALRFIKLLLYNSVCQLFKPYGYFGCPDRRVGNFINKDFAQIGVRYGRREPLFLSTKPVKHLESGYIQNRTESAAWMDAVYSLQHLYPFLDYRVVDFALSVPRRLYFNKGVSRYIYREAFRGILPEEIYRFNSKDDISKSTYFTNTLTDILTNIKRVAARLDRGIFSRHIDFDKLSFQLNNLAPDDKKNILLMKRRILRCYHIQRILADSDRPA